MLQRWHLLWAFPSINHLCLLFMQVRFIILWLMSLLLCICIDLVLPVLAVNRVRSNRFEREILYLRFSLNRIFPLSNQRFLCGCVRLCTRQILRMRGKKFVHYQDSRPIERCLSFLSHSNYRLSNVSTRPALQFLPRSLWLYKQCCMPCPINIVGLLFLHSFCLFLFLFTHFSHWNTTLWTWSCLFTSDIYLLLFHTSGAEKDEQQQPGIERNGWYSLTHWTCWGERETAIFKYK